MKTAIKSADELKLICTIISTDSKFERADGSVWTVYWSERNQSYCGTNESGTIAPFTYSDGLTWLPTDAEHERMVLTYKMLLGLDRRTVPDFPFADWDIVTCGVRTAMLVPCSQWPWTEVFVSFSHD